jgi:paraquat-inducible protein B
VKVTKSAAVGGFVLGGLALAVAAILILGGHQLFVNKLRVVVFFNNSVAGLEVGAPVTLRGVKVGSVESMKIYLKLPELIPVIPVYLEIEPDKVSWTNGSLRAGAADVEQAVKAGLRAQLATQSLVTGQLSINLDFHPDAPAPSVGTGVDAPEIPSIPSDLQHFRDEITELKLPELADKARVALDAIDHIVGELNGRVGPLADSIRQTSDAARTTLETATGAVRQVQLDASRTLGDIDQLSTVTQGQVETAGKEIEAVLTALSGTIAKADVVVGSLNDMTAVRAPLRADLESTLRDLAASANSLRDFSRQIERNPSALLLGRASK